MSRNITAMVLVPIMMLTGFRFSKNYRREVTKFHSFVYRWVNTVAANHWAGI